MRLETGNRALQTQCLGYETLATSRSQQFRQLPHSLPCFEAGHVKSPVETVDVQGQLVTGFWSIIWLENLIVKFLGMLSVLNGKNLASRVGSQ